MITRQEAEALPYRPCVGAMVFNVEGLVWVGRRSDIQDNDQVWQMPQGGIDKDETPQEAVIRECGEEMGTDRVKVLAESRDWYAYDFPPELISSLWNGRFRGQNQKWFALRFFGTDSDINLMATKHPEFSDWMWLPLDDLIDRVIPFKRHVYEGVVAEFRHWTNKIPLQ